MRYPTELMMSPGPLEHGDTFQAAWQSLWTSIIVIWGMAFGMAVLMTDTSFRRHGWRWPFRICLRACTIVGAMVAVVLFYVPANAFREAWPYITGAINTPERQTAIIACVAAVVVGMGYFLLEVAYTVDRVCRYIAAGPPWLPWHRDLDRQIKEEFHGEPRC